MDALENIFQIDQHVWPYIAMMFLRIITIFTFLPIIGEKVVPAQVRIGLAIVMTICLWPVYKNVFATTNYIEFASISSVFVHAIKELILGSAIGFCGRLLFFATSVGAQLTGINMGFQAAQMLNPMFESHESAYSFLKGITIVTLFLTLNLHHTFFIKISESFILFPMGSHLVTASLAATVTNIVKNIFLLGIQISAPVLAIQIAITIGIGVVNRILPQFNAMFFQMPLCFMLGLIVLYFSGGDVLRKIVIQGANTQTEAISHLLRIGAKP